MRTMITNKYYSDQCDHFVNTYYDNHRINNNKTVGQYTKTM